MEVVKENEKNVNDIEVNDAETVSAKQEKTQYDPSKQYTWDPEQPFVLSGKEFGLILNTIRGKVITREAMEYRMLFECNNLLEGIMAEGVNNGIIIEAPKSADR